MMVLRHKQTHKAFVCWGFSWETWSGAAPKLLVWDYLITGPTHSLITHVHKKATHTVPLHSLKHSWGRWVQQSFVLAWSHALAETQKCWHARRLNTLSLAHLIKSSVVQNLTDCLAKCKCLPCVSYRWTNSGTSRNASQKQTTPCI